MKKSFKCLTVLASFIFCFNIFTINGKSNASNININSANLYTTGYCGQLLKYNGVIVKTHYIEYNFNGTTYPAYCLDKTLPGVTETSPYSVSIENIVTDLRLWRTIINGYPYKSIEELGVATKEEAFTATKQAVYCYIHGNDINAYEGIGEAGNRTLNALKQIVNNSLESNLLPVQANLVVEALEEKWAQDDLDKSYVSKEYKIKSNTELKNLKVYLEGELPEGTKIVSIEMEEKNTFKSGDNFKIIIPIESLKQDGEFQIKLEAELKTTPILYGKAPNSGLQDYALTGYMYESFSNNILDTYTKNETKIKIIKQETENSNRIKDVEFKLLDENKNTVIENLVTDENGEILIENILPGIYYIQETNAPAEYVKNEELIQVEVKLNEQVETIINNEKVKIEQPIKKAEVIKKLPVTGM